MSRESHAIAVALQAALGTTYIVETGKGSLIGIRRHGVDTSLLAHIQGRIVWGKGTTSIVPFVTGEEKISAHRRGLNYPVVGIFKGRGWLARLVGAVSTYTRSLT